jgi:YD repeat-containing protein
MKKVDWKSGIWKNFLIFCVCYVATAAMADVSISVSASGRSKTSGNGHFIQNGAPWPSNLASFDSAAGDIHYYFGENNPENDLDATFSEIATEEPVNGIAIIKPGKVLLNVTSSDTRSRYIYVHLYCTVESAANLKLSTGTYEPSSEPATASLNWGSISGLPVPYEPVGGVKVKIDRTLLIWMPGGAVSLPPVAIYARADAQGASESYPFTLSSVYMRFQISAYEVGGSDPMATLQQVYRPQPVGQPEIDYSDPSFTRWLPLAFTVHSPHLAFKMNAHTNGSPWGNIDTPYSIALRRDTSWGQVGVPHYQNRIPPELAMSPTPPPRLSDGATPMLSITDADGGRLLFHPTTLQPTQEIRSELVALPTGGYELRHAGPPGALKSRGYFTYRFEALPTSATSSAPARLLNISDELGNSHQLVWKASGNPFLTVTDSSSSRRLLFYRNGASGYLTYVDAPVMTGTTPFVRTRIILDTLGRITRLAVYEGTSTVALRTQNFTYSSDYLYALASHSAQGIDQNFTYAPSGIRDDFDNEIPLLSSLVIGDVTDFSGSDSSTVPVGTTTTRRWGAASTPVASQGTPASRTDSFTDANGAVSSLLYSSHPSDPSLTQSSGNLASLAVTRPSLDPDIALIATTKVVATPDIVRPTIVSVTDPQGMVTESTYDSYGNVLTATDVLGNVWESTYSADGKRLLSTTDPTGQSATMHYGENGAPSSLLTSVEDSAGRIRGRTEYNSFGQAVASRTSATVHASGQESATLFEYHPVTGDLTRVTDALGHQIVSGVFDQTTRSIVPGSDYDPLGDRLAYTAFPDTGDPATSNFPLTTRMVYDATQTLRQVISPDGTTLTNNVTNAGVFTGFEVAKNGVSLTKKNWTRDSRGRVIQTRDGLGTVAKYRYDRNSNVTQLIDPKGNITQRVFGALNEPRATIWPDGAQSSIAYDINSRIKQITDERGNVAGLIYDGAGRLYQAMLNNGQSVVT